jgi:transposase-like protein
MNALKKYSQETKEEIITRFRQSGATLISFCSSPDVPVSTKTLGRWMRDMVGGPGTAVEGKPGKTELEDLRMVCYTVGRENGRKAESGLGLAEMIAFQAEVHECCTRLYKLAYTEENKRMLAGLRERLS